MKGKTRNKLLPTCCSAIFSLSEMSKWRNLMVTLEEQRGVGEEERRMRREERGLGEQEKGVQEIRARVPEMACLR